MERHPEKGVRAGGLGQVTQRASSAKAMCRPQWLAGQPWADRLRELKRVVLGGWATSRTWGLLIFMSGASPVILVMVLAEGRGNPAVAALITVGVLALLVKCLDTRIVRRAMWAEILDDPGLGAVLGEYGLIRSPPSELPRDLLSAEHLTKRPVAGRPEPLAAYIDPEGERFVVVIGTRAGDSDWDLVSAQRSPAQRRVFGISPKMRSAAKPVSELAELYRVKRTQGDLPPRLEAWLVDQRPLVEIHVRGSWTTCRLAGGSRLSPPFSTAVPVVTERDLRTLLVTADSVSRAVAPNS